MSRLPLVSPLDRALFLAAQPYFSGLDASIVATLAAYTEERFARAGEWLHHEGESVRDVFFLAEGAVRLMREEQVLREVSSPAGVSVASALSGTNWSPGILATEPTVYLALPRTDFMQILEDRFPLLVQIATTLSQQDGHPVLSGNAPSRVPETLDLIGRIVAARLNPLFAETNLTVLIELLRSAEEIELSAGEHVWQQGTRDRGVIIPIEGTLCVHDGKTTAKVEPGDVVGLAELFCGESSTVVVDATTKARVLQISSEKMIDIIEDHFEVALIVLRHLSMRFIDAW
jgi:CRP-like cAMP-binding protein